MNFELACKILHFVTAVFAAAICYSAISLSFQKSAGQKLRENTASLDGLASGFKIRQGFLIGISVSNLIRLFCESLMLYLEEVPIAEDDQTVDAVYVTSQLLPSQFYALIFSYLAAYFIYLKYSLIGYTCRYIPILWFGVIIFYFVMLIFSVVLTPDGTVVFKFVAIYDFVTLAALCWYGFGILAFISTGNTSLQSNKVISRFAPLLYISCLNIACAGSYNIVLYLYEPAKNKLVSIVMIWVLELVPSAAILWVLSGRKIGLLGWKKSTISRPSVFATPPYQPISIREGDTASHQFTSNILYGARPNSIPSSISKDLFGTKKSIVNPSPAPISIKTTTDSSNFGYGSISLNEFDPTI